MPIDRPRLGLTTLLMAAALAAAWPVLADQPLSAIDWLSQSLVTPAAMPLVKEPPVTGKGATPDSVTVQTLGADTTDSLGVLAPSVTGLPTN